MEWRQSGIYSKAPPCVTLLLTLPLLASLRDPAVAPHQALRLRISFTHKHTHTRTNTHIACWAIAQGVYVLPRGAKWGDRSKHCWYKQAWIRVLPWHAKGGGGHRWENVKWTVTITSTTWQRMSHFAHLTFLHLPVQGLHPKWRHLWSSWTIIIIIGLKLLYFTPLNTIKHLRFLQLKKSLLEMNPKLFDRKKSVI